jgi:alkanesulfonate monooxygenase SsuD/methylene tetrahydromethanopterin reductase-like flavin-dependent oxidoreductase (luciferase family)
MEIGLVLLTHGDPPSGRPTRPEEIRETLRLAEEIGFDTVRVPDELGWRTPGWLGPRRFWEFVTIAGAVVSNTSRIKVRRWIAPGPLRPLPASLRD